MKDYFKILIDIFKQEPLIFWSVTLILVIYLGIKFSVPLRRLFVGTKLNWPSKLFKLNIKDPLKNLLKNVVQKSYEYGKDSIDEVKLFLKNSKNKTVTEPENGKKSNQVKNKPKPDKKTIPNGKPAPLYEVKTSETSSTNKNSSKFQPQNSENIVEESEIPYGTKFVNYETSFEESLENYPIVRIPQNKCIIRSHQEGSAKRRGYKEDDFEEALKLHFPDNYEINGSIRLNINESTRPFEPDIAIISKNTNYNIRVDIEIDEPYAGISRQATHIKGEDYARDCYFIDRGWIVIRFSEYQVHAYQQECVQFVADLIKTIDQGFELILSTYCEELDIEPQWDLLQAQKWEKERYREKYLNHEFEIQNFDVVEYDFSLSEQEQQEEYEVVPTFIGESEELKDHADNSSDRDDRIKFYPDEHLYTVDGIPMQSASTIVSKFFPTFDPDAAIEKMKNGAKWGPTHRYWGIPEEQIKEQWRLNGEKAMTDGIFLHQQIEKYFLDLDYKEPEEFKHFMSFLKENPDLKPYRTEWRVFDEEFKLAGTIDFVSDRDGIYDIYDWKRSKNVVGIWGEPITNDGFNNKGIGVLNHIFDTSFNHYCIQQNLYRYILEKNYGVTIGKMFIVVLYPNYDQPYQFEIPQMDNEIKRILEVINN